MENIIINQKKLKALKDQKKKKKKKRSFVRI